MLNMIKHCQDAKKQTEVSSDVTGSIMGVLRKELEENNLFITSSLPHSSNSQPKTIKQLQEEDPEQKKDEASNDIGFYVSCELGLAFNLSNLTRLIVAYRNFRNAVMIVYDQNKSNFGLNPL